MDITINNINYQLQDAYNSIDGSKAIKNVINFDYLNAIGMFIVIFKRRFHLFQARYFDIYFKDKIIKVN